MTAALLGLLLSAPVILVDHVSPEQAVPKGLVAALNTSLCSTLESAFKGKKIEAKCKSDVEAILRLRSLQSAVGASSSCKGGDEACAAKMAKLVHCTHVVVASIKPTKSGYALELVLVDTLGKKLKSAMTQGADFDALTKALSGLAKELAGTLGAP
jgi:hypothetical protein